MPSIFFKIKKINTYSRLFGMSMLWRGMLSADSWRLAKTAMEESSELLGYMLIMFSALLQSWEFRHHDHLSECK